MIQLPQHLIHKNWLVKTGTSPILATAVHAGRYLPERLIPCLNPDHTLARREEDPLTGLLASSADNVFINYLSRFAGDLNRSRDKALDTSLASTWNIPIWQQAPPASVIESFLQWHDRFYTLMTTWLERLIEVYRYVVVIDIHSYNHQRSGLADPADNPDIDLGMTTLDKSRFGELAQQFQQSLQNHTQIGRTIDVRENVRYPDGGHWPEWIFEHYRDNICTITLEYKKFYMDEWTDKADLNLVEACRVGLQRSLQDIMPLLYC